MNTNPVNPAPAVRFSVTLIVALSLVLIAVLSGAAAPVLGAGGPGLSVRTRGWTLNPRPIAAGTDTLSDTVPGANTIVDFLYAPPDLWAATNRGVSRLTLPGKRWLTWGTDDGFADKEIPALLITDKGTWAANSHTEVQQDRSVPWGDGIFFYDGLSEKWVDRSPRTDLPGGGLAQQAGTAFMLCFDLASFRGGVLGACFAGGLVLTTDDGQTWQNVYADGAARVDFENKIFNDLNNRFFSVVVDSTVPESLTVYAGTAWGINSYTYLHDTLKVTGLDFADIALDGTRLYAATENGMSVTHLRGIATEQGSTWRTFYESDGLPADNIGAVAARGDTIWLGLLSADGSEGAGVAWSADDGASWIVPNPQPAQTLGSGAVRQIIVTESGAWLACGTGGLLHYNANEIDPWSTLLDGVEVNSVISDPQDLTGAALYAGTDLGIIHLSTDPLQPWDTLAVGTPADSLSQRVVRVAWQELPCDSQETAALWALVRDTDDTTDANSGFAATSDSGLTWTVSDRRLPVNDVAFFGCRFYLASDSGLVDGNWPDLNTVSLTPSYESLINAGHAHRATRRVNTVVKLSESGTELLLGELWVMADSGLSFSADSGASWRLVRSNPDPYTFDLIFHYRNRGVDTSGAFLQLTGNFIPALGLQPTGGRPVVWAAVRGTGQGRFATDFTGFKARSGIAYSRNGGLTWTNVPDSMVGGARVWNFAFHGDAVYAAASQGLYYSPDGGITWSLFNNFVDSVSSSSSDPIVRPAIDSTIEILGVEVVDDEVWVATGNGYAILDRATMKVKSIRRRFLPVTASEPGAEGGTYATPVPFSPTFARSHGGVRLHYVPPVSGAVTITIYDYANHVVRILTDGGYRDAGVQYDETDIWDGLNGEGDMVAVGTYFFVIEYTNGDVHWGKIAVIP